MKLNHNLEVLSSLKHSINEKSINDVKILVGKEKKEFYASSFLLAARSSVFRTIFFPSNSIDQTKQLELKDILPNNFLDFLNYLNTGEIELNGQNAYDILELSYKYKFENLHLACQEYLKKGINLENCLGMLENGIRLNGEALKKECWEIIDEEVDQLLVNPNSLSILPETLETLLLRNSLNCKEINLFRFVINWGKNQASSNSSDSHLSLKQIVQPFLQYIRFPLMNSKELIREVRPLGVVDDLQYIQALEFNSDKEFFEKNDKENSNTLKSQFQERKLNREKIEKVFLPGPNYVLSNNNRTIVKNQTSDGWNTTCITHPMTRGIHKWSLKILKGSNIMIGIASHKINQSESNNQKNGWYIYCNSGSLYSGPPTNYNGKTYNGSKIFLESVIDVELNMKNGTIRYFINSEDRGIAYQGIPTNEPLRLVIIFYNQGDSVQLLSHSSSY